MRRIFSPIDCGAPVSLGLLLVRLVMGAAFMFHGWGKIQHPTSWMGENAPVPAALQAAAAASEFGGGALLIPGLLTRLAALALTITMAVAAGMVHISSGHSFVAGKAGEPSWELAAIYFACSLLLLIAGPGLFSIDGLLFRRARNGPPNGLK